MQGRHVLKSFGCACPRHMLEGFGCAYPPWVKLWLMLFNPPLFFLSPASSQTFFPHFCHQKYNPPIFLAYRNSNFSVSEIKDPLIFTSVVIKVVDC
ncbi:hypothetical protein VP01_4842g1 [Puccinia sorghi]|uniref:Uncharacterized protein n=1 Tax=Puccinia sorghi TaxID=27349 RepID=A0A0L6UME2_9BASI|nr:hypothetical protein VP01_4842g1 [Puccinia sorghi]